MTDAVTQGSASDLYEHADSQTGTSWLWNPGIMLTIVVLAAAALRIYKIGGYSLWGDEGFSAAIVMQSWRPFWLSLIYEPWWAFYFVLLKPWTLCFGSGDVALRSFSALIGIVAIVPIYYLGKRLFSRRTGLIAAGITALCPVQIWYSQEVRGYSLYVLLSALCWLAFLAALHNPRSQNLSLWSVLTVLTGYCHFIGLGIIPAQWVCIAIRRPDSRIARRFALATAASLIALAPIPIFMAMLYTGQVSWILPPSWAQIGQLFVTIAGGLNSKSGVVICLILLLFVGEALFVSFQHRRDPNGWEGCLFALAGFLVPIIVTIGGAFFVPMLVARYLLVSFPPFVVLAAQGLLTFRRPKAALIMVAALVALTGRELHGIYSTEPRDDWRAAVRYVMTHSQPDDAAIVIWPLNRYVFEYYAARAPGPGAPPVVLGENRDIVDGVRIVANRFASDTGGVLRTVGSLPKMYHRVWLIRPESIGLDPHVRNERELSQLVVALAQEYRTHVPILFKGMVVLLYDTPAASERSAMGTPRVSH
ncbi:MAG: glycosyltransferase family 39 protein [Candidatus Binataceae bacterium]